MLGSKRKIVLVGAVMVLVSAVFVGTALGAAMIVAGFEAETMSLPSGSGQVFDDANASGGKALLIWSNATATKYVDITGPGDRINVRVRADQCNGSPQMTVRVNGQQVAQNWVWQTQYANYAAPVSLAKGRHKVEISMGHDYSTSTCDRNLRVDRVAITGSATTEPTPDTSSNPFAGEKFYVDPNSPAANQVREWSTTRPADAEQIKKIANNPKAAWFGDWNSNIQADVNNYVTTARNAGALPVLVAYNIPIRDCGSYSSGGATSADAYRNWINAFAAGINGRKSVVVLEPDAVALQHCLSQIQKDERNALLKYAIDTLTGKGASVYLDAGHSNWHSATEMTNRLKAAGITGARGFTVNVSNFEHTSSAVSYSNAVSSGVGGKPYVVDTSRNGNGPGDTWCNPSGRALGERPTASTGTGADAYFWIKPPGESDGTCNGGPPAGQWWPEYALGLAQHAAY